MEWKLICSERLPVDKNLEEPMTTTTTGYVGHQLRVNLSTRDSQKEIVAEELQRKFRGGASYAAKVLYDELQPH